MRLRAELEALGFRGFVGLEDLVAGCRGALRGYGHLDFRGVYGVVAPPGHPPLFRTEGLVNVISPRTEQYLRERWVPGAELLYIECAGRTQASRTLRKRLGDLARHGAGGITVSGHHKGGERIWQVVG